MSIADEKYVAFTTYKKNGEAVSLPVWIADLGDGTVGFVTPGGSWKAKRLANNNAVLVQASNGKGHPKDGTEAVAGTAVVRSDDYARVDQAIKAKYGWQRTMMGAVTKVAKLIGKGHIASDSAVIITLDKGEE